MVWTNHPMISSQSRRWLHFTLLCYHVNLAPRTTGEDVVNVGPQLQPVPGPITVSVELCTFDPSSSLSDHAIQESTACPHPAKRFPQGVPESSGRRHVQGAHGGEQNLALATMMIVTSYLRVLRGIHLTLAGLDPTTTGC